MVDSAFDFQSVGFDKQYSGLSFDYCSEIFDYNYIAVGSGIDLHWAEKLDFD